MPDPYGKRESDRPPAIDRGVMMEQRAKPRTTVQIISSRLAVAAAVLAMLPLDAASARTSFVRIERECRDPTPAKTREELAAAIYGCWTPPRENAGMGVTLRFMLLRDGTLRGKTIVAWIKPHENSPAREAFVQSAMDAVRRASPVPLSQAMQEVVPGLDIRMKFAVSDNPPAD